MTVSLHLLSVLHRGLPVPGPGDILGILGGNETSLLNYYYYYYYYYYY